MQRRAYYVEELSDEMLELLRQTQMDRKHDHLNKEILEQHGCNVVRKAVN